MKDIDKLRVLLPHWIDHNGGHGGEFSRWADTMAAAGMNDIAGLLRAAATSLASAKTSLRDALEKAGGALEGHDRHHDHHHRHEHE